MGIDPRFDLGVYWGPRAQAGGVAVPTLPRSRRSLWLVAVALICGAPWAAGAACDDPPQLIGAITNPPGTFTGDYAAAYLDVGSTYYTDDLVNTLVQVPPDFACGHWIRTRNFDRNATAASFLTFQLLERA